MDIVVPLQHLQHVPLRVLGCPLSDAFGACWGGPTGFHPAMECQRMHRTDTAFPWCVEASPESHGAKERRHSAVMFRASALEPSLTLHTRRSGFVAVGLQAIQDPPHQAPTHLASQCLALPRNRGHPLGRERWVEAAIYQLGTVRQRTRELYD